MSSELVRVVKGLVYRLVITPTQLDQGWVSLNEEQCHYLQRVLRLQDCDRIIVMNGQGLSWLAEIKGNSAKIIESLVNDTELPVAVSLMVALPKTGFDEVVRCCTELGVSRIITVISDRTLLKPSSHKVVRWRKIAQEAAEQSERQFVPTITEPVPFKQALQEIHPNQRCYLGVARGDVPHLVSCLNGDTTGNLIIATGCEGGWTDQEQEAAISIGFQPVSLGKRILRAVTAPIAALAITTSVFES